MPLDPHERDDARAALRHAGLDDRTFTFEFVPYPRLGCAAGPPLADIVVTDGATGIRRIYTLRPGSDWKGAFAADVARGVWPQG
jgi:hypothetical protein